MEKLSRRSFMKILKTIGAFLGTSAFLGPVVAYFYPPRLEETPTDPVEVCALQDLPVGSSKAVAFGRYPALIIHTPLGLKAFSAVCTHFACITKWNVEKGLIECPCHAGYFDPEDGSVVSGPPPASLANLSVDVIDGIIFVKSGDQA